MSKFQEFRSKYATFVYDRYEYVIEGELCKVQFFFQIPGLAEFAPKWTFPVSKSVDEKLLERLIFNLGMVESISYYKCVCPKVVEIRCGNLTPDQKAWWRKLYFNGLGEFMYQNDIVIDMEELVSFVTPGEDVEILHDNARYEGLIIPVGGGKDSVVSLELLKEEEPYTYHINDSYAISTVIDIYNGKARDYNPKRTLDKRMIELNQEGYLNGHTPFSAIVAFSSVITAFLNGKKYIALSNETSANEPTVKDSFVNHQYSKTYEFEKDFCDYMNTIVDSDIHYFSFLRALNELQIASVFTRYEKYFKDFRSCNVGSKEGLWCGHCPKCLFVYIIMSPFLSDDVLYDIFGKKLFDDEGLEHYFQQLMGKAENKPFECVGTTTEVCAALRTYVENERPGVLPQRNKNFILENGCNIDELLGEWVNDHNIPERYLKVLEKSMGRN